jgi:hypothetical protein
MTVYDWVYHIEGFPYNKKMLQRVAKGMGHAGHATCDLPGD